MPELSRTIRSLKASSTVAFNSKATAMRREGIDVIAMTAGEPDFQPPPHVMDAAREAIDLGLTKYTPAEGTADLREAVVGKFRRENGFDYAPNQVIVSTGGKQVLFNAMRAMLDPGDEVVLIAPYWVSYPAQVQLAGGVSTVVRTTADTGFVPDPDDVIAAFGPRTKAVILNSPCNPTGAVFPPEAVERIARAAAERDIWVVSDDIYEHLVYDGEFASAAAFAPEHTLVVHGASKAYALTGWRIGYGVGPRELIAAMTRLQGQVTSGPNALAQHAVRAALEQHEKTAAFIERTKRAYVARRDRLVAGLNDLGLRTPTPAGAFYVMADLSTIDPDEGVAAMRLLEEAHVGVVPGTDFEAPGQARFSYATSMENIETALERIADLLG